MSLDETWVFGLSEDLQEIIVGKEEESCEDESLLLQEVIKFLLDGVKILIVVLELFHDVLLVNQISDTWLFLDTLHHLFPVQINVTEHSVFDRHGL
jgi:hypothetical protein